MYDESLVLDNINLIYHILKNIHLYHRMDELYDAGLIGLIKAAKYYKPNKKIKFTTYAGTCIKNSILMVLRKEQNKQDTISLDLDISLGDNLITLKDLIPNDYNLEDEVIKNNEYEDLYEALNKLTPKEYDIISNLYNLSGNKLTQSQLAIKYNCSQAQISRINKKILKKLYNLLKS